MADPRAYIFDTSLPDDGTPPPSGASIHDGHDIITDFEVGSDKIDPIHRNDDHVGQDVLMTVVDAMIFDLG